MQVFAQHRWPGSVRGCPAKFARVINGGIPEKPQALSGIVRQSGAAAEQSANDANPAAVGQTARFV
jgi:hypothetical protein